ncbi:hypothetical protein AR689_21250 [Arthrobacter sp. EpRS71]|nr:hypothetical protein AR689_21250 [Arthrobacter sp. EpRS71]
MHRKRQADAQRIALFMVLARFSLPGSCRVPGQGVDDSAAPPLNGVNTEIMPHQSRYLGLASAATIAQGLALESPR